jgi:diguanylate cyclase (GGDEF)-like protein
MRLQGIMSLSPMISSNPALPDRGRDRSRTETDVRHLVAASLDDRAASIADDAAALLVHSGSEPIDGSLCRQIVERLVRLAALAIREGRVDARNRLAADVGRAMRGRSIAADRLNSFVYLSERAALDELAIDAGLGATTESWPLVAQLVRRASFDVLSACTARMQLDGGGSVVDTLTSLHTRALLEAVVAKEAERATRGGDAFSLILFDVDRLSRINDDHGWDVGDQILARVGLLIRNYFRRQDWVARHADDSMAVLLTRTGPADSRELAERVRSAVETRLASTDHRTGSPLAVTVSAAVMHVRLEARAAVDVDRLMAGLEAAVLRAKQLGRNRVEVVDGYQLPYSSS